MIMTHYNFIIDGKINLIWFIFLAVLVAVMVIVNLIYLTREKRRLSVIEIAQEDAQEMREHVLTEMQSIVATVFRVKFDEVTVASSLSALDANYIVFYVGRHYKFSLYVDWCRGIKIAAHYINSLGALKHFIKKSYFTIDANTGDISYEKFHRFVEKFKKMTASKLVAKDYDNALLAVVEKSLSGSGQPDSYSAEKGFADLMVMWDNYNMRCGKNNSDFDMEALVALTRYLIVNHKDAFLAALEAGVED